MMGCMSLSISEVAKKIGLRPSAIRYYEQIGILPPAHRVSGQRHYDVTVLHRLTVIHRARQTGFTLGEIKELFFGFRAGTPPSVRWQKLRKRKILELDAMLEHIQSLRALVKQQGKCRCAALEECGKKMFEKHCASSSRVSPHKADLLLSGRQYHFASRAKRGPIIAISNT
jgi:MerR family transcriptional regulator, redox-sensitive transcriptional activator SoxR